MVFKNKIDKGTEMPVLRLKIYQPHAHYRIPFTFSRRHTYPIPPYSTVIGFLCNACGVDDQNKDLYRDGIRELKISISGRFKQKTTEMIWFRNLNVKNHIVYYGNLHTREKNGQIGHIGGQMPVKIDVLEEVRLVIHLYHQDTAKIEEIKECLERDTKRLQPLHLGRSEDWIVYEEIKVLDDSNFDFKRRDANYQSFFWIPKETFTIGKGVLKWDKFDGLLYTLPTFSRVRDYQNHHNHAGEKIYERIMAKLNDGKILETECLFDTQENIPVFFANFQENENNNP